jgi:hypothetical protein
MLNERLWAHESSQVFGDIADSLISLIRPMVFGLSSPNAKNISLNPSGKSLLQIRPQSIQPDSIRHQAGSDGGKTNSSPGSTA